MWFKNFINLEHIFSFLRRISDKATPKANNFTLDGLSARIFPGTGFKKRGQGKLTFQPSTKVDKSCLFQLFQNMKKKPFKYLFWSQQDSDEKPDMDISQKNKQTNKSSMSLVKTMQKY